VLVLVLGIIAFFEDEDEDELQSRMVFSPKCRAPWLQSARSSKFPAVSGLHLSSGNAHSAGMNGAPTHNIGSVQQPAAVSEHERHLLHTLMDHLPDDIYFKDLEGRFLRHNRAHARRLGLADTAQAIGKTDFDFFSREHAQQAYDDEQQVIRTGRPITKEEKETWPDVPETWVLTTKMPFRDESGCIVGTFGISRDITENKRNRDQVRALNEDLHSQMAEREEIYRELESFSYSVSHDLRSPIRHIQGYSQMLAEEMKDRLSPKARSHLDTIIGVSRSMGQLIDDLLAFSRIARVEMRQNRVDLNLFLEETIRGLKLAAKDRNILWKTSPLPAVIGDAALLKLVLLNLVGNAVKYTGPRNPAEIEIASAGVKDGRTIFFVRDNGVGFDMQYHHKLFNVFQRLHAQDDFEGTGTGLAVVRRIISRHGGQVWAEARPAAGATFYFTLKAA
jgi:PAS domain S-box-containing protein